jgi:aryl-alcohol dehydrogenase-like predicted oxidoreductase
MVRAQKTPDQTVQLSSVLEGFENCRSGRAVACSSRCLEGPEAALEAGINFIDTADVYGGGASETMLGMVLEARRHEIVLATKFGGRTSPGPNQLGQSRIHVMEALDASLKRLKTDHIDLYQLHNFDRFTPIEETLRALDNAIRIGKVRYIGLLGRSRKLLASQRDRGWQNMRPFKPIIP